MCAAREGARESEGERVREDARAREARRGAGLTRRRAIQLD